MNSSEVVKTTVRLDHRIHAALLAEARSKGRDIGEHMQIVLLDHVVSQELVDLPTAREFEMRASLIERVGQTALRVLRRDGFDPHISLKTINALIDDKQWLGDYEAYIGGNAFRHGNPVKASLNREIGGQIRKAIGGKVAKTSDGNPVMVQVAGSIVQRYTVMQSATETPSEQEPEPGKTGGKDPKKKV